MARKQKDLADGWRGWGPERVRHRHKFYAVGLKNDGSDVDLEFIGGYPYVYDTEGSLFKRTTREDDRGRRIYEEHGNEQKHGEQGPA